MKKSKRLLSVLLLLSLLLPMLPITAVSTFAISNGKTDAMEEINADGVLDSYLCGGVQEYEDDGYIGIPYEVSVYYDNATHGKARAGYMATGATPVILYVVNADFERVGTDSDVSIIKSMLERGYAVVVVDYLNDPRATRPALDWSVQLIYGKAAEGDYFTNQAVFDDGVYDDTMIVPSGCNVRLNDVYFELDKHGVDGTLEEIVKLWNNDFRGCFGNKKVIRWVHEDGTRKATQNGHDGTAPVWYADAAGTQVDEANGQYIKIKHTKALEITDCVKPDGTPIDLNLYMHTVYPTNPKAEVPVVVLFSAAESLSSCLRRAERPQFTGFLFSGYAASVADYAWIPMGRADHYGQFSGDASGGVTGVNMTYATYTYNATQSATAALRRIRYLAFSDPETYAFDVDRIGSFGISKTAWYTQLGAPILRNDLLTTADGYTEAEIAEHVNDKINSFSQLLLPVQCSGRTRYDNGDVSDVTVDGFTVDGGELQPWAVYAGKEISSGVQANYSSCGGFVDYFSEGYAPQFITENLSDTANTEYGQQNIMVNLCRNLNIPALWFEVDVAHTFGCGKDYNYGVDVYDAFFDFMNYYLKGTPVSVAYTTPQSGDVISTTDGVTVKFIGEVTSSEIEKIRITDGDGNVLDGVWRSSYGGTEWCFTAKGMQGKTAYTLTIPADMKGANGVEMGKTYTTGFYTRAEGAVVSLENDLVIDETGKLVTLTVPEKTASGFSLRVLVENDAANTLYAYNAATNELMGSVRVSGRGYHEIDVTDALAALRVGSSVSVRLFTEKEQGAVVQTEKSFDSDNGGLNYKFSQTTVGATIEGEKAIKIVRITEDKAGEYRVYPNMENSFTIGSSKLIKGGTAVNGDDLGRTFLLTLRVYDTVSRPVRIYMNSATSRQEKQLDFDRVYYTYQTTANGWSEFQVPYTVYEMKYGIKSQVKEVYVQFAPVSGIDGAPIYLDHLTVEEIFTDIEATSVTLVSHTDSEKNVKAPISEKAFKIGSAEYTSWKDAMSVATNGVTVTMLRNYTLTDSDLIDLSARNNLVIDLNGYRLTAANHKNAPVWISATSASGTNLTLKNGSVILGDTPLIDYGGSSAAGNGKTINVNLEDLYVTVAKNAATLSIVSAGAVSNATRVLSNVNLSDCVIDVKRENLPDKTLNGLVYFHSGDLSLSVKYTVAGGKIVANGFHEAVFCESVIDVIPNASEEYLRVLVPMNVAAPVGSFKKDGEYTVLKSTSAENGYAVYTAERTENCTEYGAIPEDFADPIKYPFVIFMDGAFIDGKGTWMDTLIKLRTTLTANPGSTVQILMQRDYDITTYVGNSNWFCYMNGSILLDLNGYALTAKSSSIFEIGVDAGYTGNYKTTLRVINGRIVQGNGNVCGIQNNSSYAKAFDVFFENVDFGIDPESFDGSKRKSLFYAQTNCKASVELTLSLTDCDIDLSGINTPYTVFSFASSDTHVSADIRMNGGSIKSDSLDSITFLTLDSTNDSFLWGKGDSGAYTKLILPASYPLTKAIGGVNDEGKTVAFGNGVSNGSDKTYTLVVSGLVTPYGNIPESASNATTYPFVLFNASKEYVGAYTSYVNMLNAAKTHLDNHPGKTVYALMRTNYANTGYFPSIGVLNGTLVLDLGGFDILRQSNSLIEAGSMNLKEAQCAFATNLVVRNGRMLAMGASANGHIVAIESKVAYNKTVNLTFENVTFSVSEKWNATAGINTVIVNDNGGNGTGKITSSITFLDCTFDFTGSEGTVIPKTTKLIYGKSNILNVTVKGGCYKGGAQGITFANLNSASSLRYEKGGDGKYLYFDISTGTPPAGGISTDRGTMYFVRKTDNVYTLAVRASECANALIPYEYYDDQSTYPFVLYTEGGTLVDVAKSFKGMLQATKTYLEKNPGDTVYALMRRDFANTEYFPSIGVLNGTLVLDLGGFDLLRQSNSLIEAGSMSLSEAQCAFATNLVIKNGRVLAMSGASANGHIVAIESKTAYNKTVNLTFENITFAVSELWNAEKGINTVIVNDNGGNGSGKITSSIVLKDCTFDFRGTEGTVVPTSTRLFFGKSNNVSITVEGGKYLGFTSGIAFANLNAESSLTFTRNAVGEYFSYDIIKGSPLTGAVNTAEGDGYFYHAGNGKHLLGIGRAKITGASLNIGADLSMLYYVRVHDSSLSAEDLLMKFTIASKSTVVSEYTEKDGEYIFVLTGIAPQQIGDKIDAILLLGDTEIASKLQYSVKDNLLSLNSKDAETLGISAGKYAAMKTLIADLLLYGKAAQDYVGYLPDAPVLNGTEGIVGSTTMPESDDMVLSNNVASKPYFKNATVRFDTVNEIRIHIFAGNADASLVTVKVDGKEIALSDLTALGNGSYLVTISDILATELDTVHTVALALDGVDGASLSYSVNAYAYAMQNGGTQDADMRALALALYRYGVSADAYMAIA